MYPTNLHLLGPGATLDHDYRYGSEGSITLDPRAVGVKEGDRPMDTSVLTNLYGDEYDEGNSIDEDEEKNWEDVSDEGVDLYTIPGSPKDTRPPDHDDTAPLEGDQVVTSLHEQPQHTEPKKFSTQVFTMPALPLQDGESELGEGIDLGEGPNMMTDTEGLFKPSAAFINFLNNTDLILPSDTEESDDYDPFTFLYNENDPYESLPVDDLEQTLGENTIKKTNDFPTAPFATSDDEIVFDFAADHTDMFNPLEKTPISLKNNSSDAILPESLQKSRTFNVNLDFDTVRESPHAVPNTNLDVNNEFSERLWAQSGWSISGEETGPCKEQESTPFDTDTHIQPPVSLRLRLVTCGSTVEKPTSLNISEEDEAAEREKAHFFDETSEKDRTGVFSTKLNDFGFPAETREEFKLRRLKERTIDHDDFATLEESTLSGLFFVQEQEDSGVRIEQNATVELRPTEQLPSVTIPTSSRLTHTPQATKAFTLYSKDKVSAQVENDKFPAISEDKQDEETLEDWIQSITRGLESDLDDGKSANPMAYIDGGSLFLEFTISASEEEDAFEGNLNYDQHLSATRTHDSNMSPTVLCELTEGTENTQIAKGVTPKSHGEGTDDTEDESPLAEEIGTAGSLSPAGTMTAPLVSHYQNETVDQSNAGTHFQERYRSVSEAANPESHSIWTLNNRFASLPLPQQPKRRKSIRRIFFPKSAVPSETEHQRSNTDLNNQSQTITQTKADSASIPHTPTETDTKGSLKLKTLWRSKTFSRKPSTAQSFNLESGVSLNTVAAAYLYKTELSFPDENDTISNGTESMRRMLSKKDRVDVTLASSDSQDTLTSLIEEKFGTHHKSVSEHIPTPAPFPSIVQDVHENLGTKRHFLGLRRSKTVSARRNPTIRFATTPEYITDETSKDDHTLEKSLDVDDNAIDTTEDNLHKSILKRSHTLGSHGKTRSIFRSLFGYND